MLVGVFITVKKIIYQIKYYNIATNDFLDVINIFQTEK